MKWTNLKKLISNREEGATLHKKRRLILTVFIVLVCGIAVILPSYLIAQSSQSRESQFTIIEKLYAQIANNYVEEVDSDALIQGALSGMMSALDDPYSTLLSEDELMRLEGMVLGSFGGLGMYVDKQKGDEVAGYIEVISPIINTPAERKGLRSGDLIIEIDGDGTGDMTLNDAVMRLRGEIGTDVELSIKRRSAEPFPVILTRASIEVPTVEYGMIDDTVGYIRIFVFTSHTGAKIREALGSLLEQRAEHLIVDLRDNGGGALDGAIRAVDPFFRNKLVVSVQGRDGTRKIEHKTTNSLIADVDIPILILINGASASASEIFAGAFKDHGRAELMGTTTYGKGSVQQIISVDDYAIRLTTARYYTPSGSDIDSVGIEPDILHEGEELTDEEVLAYTELVNQGLLDAFIDEGNFAPAEIERFVGQIQEDLPDMNEEYFRHRLRQEVYRSVENKIQLFDLQYDSILRKAIEYFN